MTTEHAEEQAYQERVASFARKLHAFATTLTAEEQVWLPALLTAAPPRDPADAEVQGYAPARPGETVIVVPVGDVFVPIRLPSYGPTTPTLTHETGHTAH